MPADDVTVVPSPLALQAARAVVRHTRGRLVPVDGELPGTVDGAVLLVDRTPCDELLAELAAALPTLAALVMWCPGWAERDAVETLGRHGLAHGTVEIVGDGALSVLVATEDAAAALAPALARPQRPFRALAVMPAFNEADVIYHSIGALIADGVDVYLIDHESTDGTAAAAAPWLGRGLVHIERFPDDAGFDDRNRHEMVWRDILTRVQDVTGEVPADWYLFVNADEFREAPWPGVSLGDALREVDELGYSAVNFELYDFKPTDDRCRPGTDPRLTLRHYEPPGRHDLLQIKAWKAQTGPVDLVHHGGHDILFEGKRVFPVPFILRHYPIRSSEHGRRKVLGERLPRFAAEERADGWHVQYDRYAEGADYLHEISALTEWDGNRERAHLLAQALRRLLLDLCLTGSDRVGGEVQVDRLNLWMERRGTVVPAGVDLQQAQQRLAVLSGGTQVAPDPALDTITGDLALALEVNALLRGDVRLSAVLGDARAVLTPAA